MNGVGCCGWAMLKIITLVLNDVAEPLTHGVTDLRSQSQLWRWGHVQEGPGEKS